VDTGAGPRGTLFIVGTPIGNLQDLSPRAAATLAQCRVIACEDTRTTRTLLDRNGISARLLSYHKFNERLRAAELLAVLGRGESVALVTDAGTPGVSDPGAHLVRRARAAGHRVVPIPGPSALTALLSSSGFASGPFTFVGFLPHRQGERRRLLEALRDEARPLVFFEAPHRLIASLDDVLAILGDREGCLGREMTKVHEEFVAGPLSVIRKAFEGRPVRGEITFVVAGAPAGTAAATRPAAPVDPPGAAVERLIAAGWDRKEAMRRVARERGLSRRAVYNDLLRARRRAPDGDDG
jgi:16S rRNA (cytidine1402-2'-O)-methyltransferase